MTREIFLHVYLSPSGQWSGRLLESVGGIAGCASPADVIEAARDQYPEIDFQLSDNITITETPTMR